MFEVPGDIKLIGGIGAVALVDALECPERVVEVFNQDMIRSITQLPEATDGIIFILGSLASAVGHRRTPTGGIVGVVEPAIAWIGDALETVVGREVIEGDASSVVRGGDKISA